MTHTWKITRESVLPEHLGFNQVIKTIWFELTSTDGINTAIVDGRINLQIENLTEFIDYQDVSDTIRLNWIKAKYGDDYENYNVAQINNQF